MFKILKNILLSLLVTSYAFSMTEEEYNNHPFHNKSVLNEFISLSGEKQKLKIILDFIDFFLKGEELAIKQENSTNYSNKLSNEYIEEYFSVKKEYYKSFYEDGNRYFLGVSPLEYIIYIISDGYNNKNSLIDNFTNNPNKEHLKFLYNYVVKYVKDSNLIVGNASYDVMNDNEIYEKSNNILKNRINGLIKKVIVGDFGVNPIVGYYFENNIDKNMNELAELLNDNKTLFSFDYDRIIHSDKTKLKIVNISSKQCINIHSIRQITKVMSYHDLYILKLLEFFLRDFNEKQDEQYKKAAIPVVAERPAVEQVSEIDFRKVSLPGATDKKETKIDKKTQKKIDEAQRNADKLIAEETKKNKNKNKNKNKKQPKPKPKAKLNKEQEQKAKLKAEEEEEKQARIAAKQKAIEERKKQKELRRKAEETRIAEKKAKQEEANKKAAEEAKRAEQQRKAELEKAKHEELVEEAKIAEEQRKQLEEESRILEQTIQGKKMAAEKAKQEKLAAQRRAAPEKAKQEKLRAAAERAEQEKLAAEIKAAAEKARQKKLVEDAKIAAQQRKAELEKARQEKLVEDAEKRKQPQQMLTLISNSNGEDKLIATNDLVKREIGKKILNKINQVQNTLTLVSNSDGQDDFMNTTELINMKNRAMILVVSLLTDIRSIENIYSQSKILTTIHHNLEIGLLERMENLREEIEGCVKYIMKEFSVYENYNTLLEIKKEIDVYLKEQNNYIHTIEETYLATSSIGFYDGRGYWYPNPSNHSNH